MPRASAGAKVGCSAVVVSVGCPSGIGPEVSVAAAARFDEVPAILVGDLGVIRRAAELRGVSQQRVVVFEPGSRLSTQKLHVLPAGPALAPSQARAGKPSRLGGQAQLEYIERAYDLVRALPGSALVTGPVSKLAIAESGLAKARGFRGHTEWLQARDGAESSVMCFASSRLVTSLVTTHLPLSKVSRALSKERVHEATLALAALVGKLRPGHPKKLAVCSLNPHAGEGELLGLEENRAIVPGIRSARRKLGRSSSIVGPIGAETAFRKALAGDYDGVVAMYHDQATVPMKLVAFGEAVNVTMGLSVVRTSVDHGTGYDIAGRGIADDRGMLAALRLGARLVG